MSDAYVRVAVGRYSDGRTMVINKRTAGMLDMVQRRIGFELTIVQGSYNTGGVSASAGTHDGGGVVDLRTWNLTVEQRNEALAAARAVGFYAWYRTTAQGFDPHFHWVAKGDAELSSDARWQASEAEAGRNGLASRGTDTSNLNVPTFNYTAYLEWIELTELADRVAVLEARVTATTNARAQSAYASVIEGGAIENRVSTLEGRVTYNTDARAQHAYKSVTEPDTEGTIANRVTLQSKLLEELRSKVGSLEAAVDDLYNKHGQQDARIAALEAAPKP